MRTNICKHLRGRNLARSNKFSTPFWAKRNPTRHQGRLATITTVGDSRLTVSFDDNQPGSFVDYKVALLLPPRGTASYASNEYDILWTDNEGHITPLERNRIVDHLTRALGAAILRRLGISFVLLIHWSWALAAHGSLGNPLSYFSFLIIIITTISSSGIGRYSGTLFYLTCIYFCIRPCYVWFLSISAATLKSTTDGLRVNF
jgi:hypothetical protein